MVSERSHQRGEDGGGRGAQGRGSALSVADRIVAVRSALPKMAKAAQSAELKAAFEKHEGETEGQIERLEQVFEIIGSGARKKVR